MIQRFRSTDNGAALVELALVLPILLFLVSALWEYGRLLDTQVVVSNAAREGARYAVFGESTAVVQDRVASYLTSGLGTRLNATSGDVVFTKTQVTVTNASGFPGTPVVVQVPVTVKMWVPGLVGLPNTVALSAAETMRLQCGGSSAC